MIQNKPFFNIGPGNIIKREMEALNWTQEDLAEILGMSPKSISKIINNKQAITIDSAILLGKVFDTSPEFWLNLEQNYRLRIKAGGKKEDKTSLIGKIRKFMPLSLMKKKGWLSFDRSVDSQIKAYQEFWDQQKIDFSVYQENPVKFCMRQAKENPLYTRYYTQTWIKKAEKEALLIKSTSYQEKVLKNLLKRIPDFTNMEDGISLFIEELENCGIKFMVLSHLEKTYLDGAAFWQKENPVIVLTARYKNNDSFWWTIAHEIVHALLHIRTENDCFIDDNLDKDAGDNEKELEADRMVSEILKVREIKKLAEPFQRYFTEIHLLEISNKLNIHPGVVLGILQFSKMVTYKTKLNSYKLIIDKNILEKYMRG